MTKSLSISVGQYSSQGRKAVNQDFHGIYIPQEPELSTKGIAVAIADGISSSEISQKASRAAVTNFFEDFYTTPESWSVKTAAERVLQSINSWLYAQTRQSPYRYDIEKGYVCTFSAIIFKSNKAYLFHAGDSRIYRCADIQLQQLTDDHRHISEDDNYLTCALGIEKPLKYDYKTLPVKPGEIFILATDGVYEFVDDDFIINTIREHTDDLDSAAKIIVEQAYQAGSHDNLTLQLVRVNALPEAGISSMQQQITTLPLPPELKARMQFDGFEIVREMHISSRSHVFLAIDNDTQRPVIIKTLASELQDDPIARERFLMEDWIARRLNNAHLLKAVDNKRQRHYLYTVTEYIEGQNLSQWLHDNPNPSVDAVRRIIGQIAKGLQAMHRQEMVHQDIRPDNIMIDRSGTVKIIDFGATRVAGIAELGAEAELILGTAQFTAPEYFLGEAGTPRADIFSLGVLTYYLLSGALPYGNKIAKAYSVAAQRKLNYQSIIHEDRTIPFWVDDTIKKAVHINPYKRYQEVSEFAYDLGHPNQTFLNKARPPLIERNPVLFWQCISLLLLVFIIYQNWPST